MLTESFRAKKKKSKVFYPRMSMFRLIQKQMNILNLTHISSENSLKVRQNKKNTPNDLPQNKCQGLISYLFHQNIQGWTKNLYF